MRYTDIVKARALRRAGRACEMCGLRVSFESGKFVSAHPIFGVLFDQDDCCVLCAVCLSELDGDTRAAAEAGPPSLSAAYEACPEPDELDQDHSTARLGAAGEDVEAGREEPPGPATIPRGARDAWLPRRDPDGGMCA